MKRQIIAEYLDTDSGTPAEIQGSLTDLRRANQWFGGIPTTQAMIQRVAQASHSSSLSLLEVAAGSSNVPESVSTRLSRRGLSLEVTLLDRAHTHLNSSARSMVGDALAIPCLDNSFDIVSCTLFAHHLGPADIVRFVNEGLRVARKAVLINDLIRDPVHLMFIYAGFLFYSSRLTRHDAPASLRQAYTVPEIREMLEKTSAVKVEISRHYLYRMGAIAWKSLNGR